MVQPWIKNAVAVLIIGLVGVGISLSIWAGRQVDAIRGPSLMVQDTSENIWVLSDKVIYKLDQRGFPLDVVRLSQLGIYYPLGDFYPHPSGDIIVAIMATQEIKRYNSEGKLLSSFAIKEVDPDQNYGALKFALDLTTDRYFVTDTRNHQVSIFNANGDPQGGFGQKGAMEHQFHFPNRISFGHDDLLYIADTNNHRISVRNRQGTSPFSIPTVDLAGYRYEWPTHFSFGPHDAITVINRDRALEEGELVIVKPHKGIIRRILLPLGTQPENVLVRRDDFLVTDLKGLRILRISHDGTLQGSFGVGTFQTALSTALAKREWFQMIQQFSIRGLIFLVCLLLIGLVIERGMTSNKAKKDGSQPTWLATKPLMVEPTTRTRKATTIVGIAVALLIASVASVFHSTDQSNVVILLVALTACIGGLMLLVRGTKEGLFRSGKIREMEKILRRHETTIGKSLKPGETVQLYNFVNRRKGIRTPFLKPLMDIDMVLLVVTNQRILLFKMDLWGWRLNNIQEISFYGIYEVNLEPPSKWDQRLLKGLGVGWLSLKLREEERAISFQIPLPGQAELIQQEIKKGQSTSPVEFMGIRRICRNCYSSIPTLEIICPGCRRKIQTPWRIAILSMLYPGLGQLANQDLFKGVLFLTLNTFTLLFLLITLLTWYRGTAEVAPTAITTAIRVFLTIWISSVVDAYYTARRS